MTGGSAPQDDGVRWLAALPAADVAALLWSWVTRAIAGVAAVDDAVSAGIVSDADGARRAAAQVRALLKRTPAPPPAKTQAEYAEQERQDPRRARVARLARVLSASLGEDGLVIETSGWVVVHEDPPAQQLVKRATHTAYAWMHLEGEPAKRAVHDDIRALLPAAIALPSAPRAGNVRNGDVVLRKPEDVDALRAFDGIEGGLHVAGPLEELALPRLITCGSLSLASPVGALLLPSLQHVRGAITCPNQGRVMRALDLSSLARVDGAIDLPLGHTFAGAVALPKLVYVGGDVDISFTDGVDAVDFGALTTVLGEVSIVGAQFMHELALSSLQTARKLVVMDCATFGRDRAHALVRALRAAGFRGDADVDDAGDAAELRCLLLERVDRIDSELDRRGSIDGARSRAEIEAMIARAPELIEAYRVWEDACVAAGDAAAGRAALVKRAEVAERIGHPKAARYRARCAPPAAWVSDTAERRRIDVARALVAKQNAQEESARFSLHFTSCVLLTAAERAEVERLALRRLADEYVAPGLHQLGFVDVAAAVRAKPVEPRALAATVIEVYEKLSPQVRYRQRVPLPMIAARHHFEGHGRSSVLAGVLDACRDLTRGEPPESGGGRDGSAVEQLLQQEDIATVAPDVDAAVRAVHDENARWAASSPPRPEPTADQEVYIRRMQASYAAQKERAQVHAQQQLERAHAARAEGRLRLALAYAYDASQRGQSSALYDEVRAELERASSPKGTA